MTTVNTLGGWADSSNSGLMFRNKLINSDIRIDQRNSGSAVSNTTGSTFPCDRFVIDGSASSKFSGQQSSIAPTGFAKSLSLTSSAATTVASTDYYRVMQHIEGQNVADLAWGTAAAKTVTISFWVYSTLTGTFSGALRNSAANRSYPFTYTVNSASTWEYKTITIPGDTTGTWLTDSGIGISVIFSLGCGSTRIGTAGSWAAANYMGATGETQLVATNGANLRISGIQLEAGSQATPFEQRPIGMELSLCQRYYETGNINGLVGAGLSNSFQSRITFVQPKRGTNSVTIPATSLQPGGASVTAFSYTTNPDIYGTNIGLTASATTTYSAYVINGSTIWTCSAEL